MTYVALFVILALLLAAWLTPPGPPALAARTNPRCPIPPLPRWRGEARGWLGGRL